MLTITVKDLGEIGYYLGIRVSRDVDGSSFLDQIASVLDKFGVKDAKGATTPMDAAYTKLEGEHDRLPNNELYRQAAGHCCMWPPLLVLTLLLQ